MNAIRIVVAAGLFVSAAGIAACASKPESKDKGFMTYEEYKANAPEPDPPPDPCRESDGSPRPCSDSSECCDGHTCGLDPDRSRVQRYCL